MRCRSIWLLCGWLLFTPPTDIFEITPGRKEVGVVTNAPLKQWKHEASFDTAKECEAAKANPRLNYSQIFPGVDVQKTVWENARCLPQ